MGKKEKLECKPRPQKKIWRDGCEVQNNQIVLGEIEYDDPDHLNKRHAFGLPINADVAFMMINDYWIERKGKDNTSQIGAFTIGKESLLSILSQENCEAIRFYLANWKKDFFADKILRDSRENGITIIAVGVNSQDTDLGARNDEGTIAKPPKPKRTDANGILNNTEDGEIREMVPPFTIVQHIQTSDSRVDKSGAKDLSDIIKEYFTQK